MAKKQPNLKKYPSKVILFGEYTILIGGNVLAVPFDKYYASWHFGKHFPHNAFISHVKKLLSSNQALYFMEAEWNEFTKNHGYLESSIPNGYGLGSSGTVVAAFFDTFITAPEDFKNDAKALKKLFSEMECYFHGTSSGIDPLLSYIQQPILYKHDTIDVINYNSDLLHFDLIDSGGKRYMDKLVTTFTEKLADQTFYSNMQLLQLGNNSAISALIDQNVNLLYDCVKSISELQFTHLQYLITDSIKKQWEAALITDGPKYKLCGAGGGGFYMKVDVKNIT